MSTAGQQGIVAAQRRGTHRSCKEAFTATQVVELQAQRSRGAETTLARERRYKDISLHDTRRNLIA